MQSCLQVGLRSTDDELSNVDFQIHASIITKANGMLYLTEFDLKGLFLILRSYAEVNNYGNRSIGQPAFIRENFISNNYGGRFAIRSYAYDDNYLRILFIKEEEDKINEIILLRDDIFELLDVELMCSTGINQLKMKIPVLIEQMYTLAEKYRVNANLIKEDAGLLYTTTIKREMAFSHFDFFYNFVNTFRIVRISRVSIQTKNAYILCSKSRAHRHKTIFK